MSDFIPIDPQEHYRNDIVFALDEIYRMVSDYQLQKGKTHAPELLKQYKLCQNGMYRSLLKKYGTQNTNRKFSIFAEYQYDNEDALKQIVAYKKNWKNMFMNADQKIHFMWYCFNAHIADLNVALKKRDDTIADLENRVIDCQINISDLEIQVDMLQDENHDLHIELGITKVALIDAGIINMPVPVYDYTQIASRIAPFKKELLTVYFFGSKIEDLYD